MNIGAIVQQNYLKGRLKELVRDDSPDKTAKSPFQERLAQFRQDNVLEKLNGTQEASPDKIDKEPAWGENLIFSGRLFDSWDGNLSADAALNKLDENLSQLGQYSLDSGADPREALQHIAAQYTVYKQHISQTGDKKQLESLDKLIERHTQQYAKSFSEAVGSFYEENGLVGERERIYQSVQESVKMWSVALEECISLSKIDFQKLKNDAQENGKSLANELRKAARGIFAEAGRSIKLHSSSTLATAAKLAKFSKNNLHMGVAKIKNEEELGLEMGKVALEAHSFLKTIYAKSEHQQAFLKSVQNLFDQHLDKVDTLLLDETARYKKNNPFKTDNPFEPLNRDAVFAVVQAMTADYEKTGSISSAMNAGKAYGLKAYLSKADVESKTERYRDSHFWGDIVKKALEPETEGARQYQWIRDLMESKTNTWLNLLA